MFTSHDPGKPKVICEDCYWKVYYGEESYSKKYKHCILSEAITPEVSRRICQCEGGRGSEKAPFPVDKNANHAKVAGNAAMQCDLLKLKDVIIQAKKAGIEQPSRASKHTFSRLLSKSKLKLRRNKQNPATSINMPGMIIDPHKDMDIPPIFRKRAEGDPFGDIHMALRVGPLIIENGVPR